MNTRYGFQIARVLGIPVRIHYTFLLVLPFLAYAFGQNLIAAARLAGVPANRLSGSPWLWGLVVALALFASVLVHELAHSLYALARGGKVRSITLLMIGGVSELAAAPRRPSEEAWMALAGPATSLAIGVTCLSLFWASTGLGGFDLRFGLFTVAELNLFLGLFNLLPAFPMDGGRVLRGLLAPALGPVRATQIASGVGKAFAVVFAVVGFATGNLLLVLIAFFVYMGAAGEQHAVLVRAVLGELRVGDLMKPQSEAVAPDDNVFDVGERMLREKRLSFPVAEAGHVIGAITHDAVERVPLDRRRRTPTRAEMVPVATIGPADQVSDALRRLADRRGSSLAVVEGDRLVGTLSQVDIARGLQLQELAVSQHPRAGGAEARS
ncbi:MAG TPA: site-2 protease family protein [Anaeromyxobacteraceae bacterium]|nr:site-2 protease family protein [Anaeromyxobacteraceae bacterium]